MADNQAPPPSDQAALAVSADLGTIDVAPEADRAPAAAPQAPAGHVNIWNISGPKPVMGSIDPAEVTEAVASGKFSLPTGQPVKVISPDGVLGTIDPAEAGEAFKNGYKFASHHDLVADKYGGTADTIKAGLEGAASAATFGLSTGVERAVGVDPEAIEGRREANPIAHGVGEGVGLLGSALIPVVGEANVLTKAGQIGAKAVGLAAPVGLAAKVGSTAVKMAVENALFQSGDEVSKMLSAKDPQAALDMVETAVTDVGISALFGAAVGGAGRATLGAVSPLWKAVSESKTGEFLKTLANHAGGIEGALPEAADSLIAKSGMDVAPELRPAMSGDRDLQEMGFTLAQSDTTAAGKAYQAATEDLRQQAGDRMAVALGREPEAVAVKGDLSKYEGGKSIGHALADDVAEKIEPLAAKYEELGDKFKGMPLAPSIADKLPAIEAAQDKALTQLTKLTKAAQKAQKAGNVEQSIELAAQIDELHQGIRALQVKGKAQGTTDMLVDQISKLAEEQGWSASPSSDIMKEVNRIVKELPLQKDLKALTNYIKQVGDNTASTLPFGQQTPVSRAGGMIKRILRDAEGEIIGHHIGSEEGTEALEAYRALQKNYAKVAELKDAIDDRLKAGGSVAAYAKSVRAMATEEGEKVLSRLAGNKDADWLRLAQEQLPRTAQKLKEYHLDAVLSASKEGERLSTAKILSGIQGMSPELRQFAIKGEALDRVKAIGEIVENLNDKNFNFSRTARVMDKLSEYLPASAMGIIGAITNHPVAGLVLGPLVKTLGKDVPDAARLGLLKFLGSAQPVEAEGFKAMVDFIHATQRGESLVSKATKNIFKAGAEVLPQSLHPTPQKREKLEKHVQEIQLNPQPLMNAGGKTAHYLPNEGAAIGQTASSVINFLNSVRPSTDKQAPLDRQPVATPQQKSAYNRALDIAEQPLVVLNHIKEGRLLASDVIAIKAMYPALYGRLSQKLTSDMIEHIHKGESIPYKTRLGLSLFLGQPLDSTMTPQAIQSAQMAQMGPQRPENQGGEGQHAKHSMNSLNKFASRYQTPEQARQAARAKHSQ